MLQTASPTTATALPLPELYRRVERHIPPFEWPILADDIAAILKLKRERNAVVLAHNYQTPDIFHTVADIVGDSLALAREAARTDADVIVLAGSIIGCYLFQRGANDKLSWNESEQSAAEIKKYTSRDLVSRERSAYLENPQPHFETYGPKTRRAFLEYLKVKRD